MSSNHQPANLARKAYAGLFWQVLGFSLNTLLSVTHIVIMARLLSPEVFGQFAIATIIIALTAIISEFGLGPALVQKATVSDEDISFVFLFNILTGLALFFVLIGFAETISHAFNGAVSTVMVQVLAITLLVQPIGLASKALLLRKMEFHRIFVATNLSYFIGMLLVGVSLALFGYGIWSLIIGLIISSAVISIYYLFVSPIKFSFKFNIRDSTYLVKYGIGLTSVQGVNQFSLMADKLILTQLTSNAFLGLYERSQRIQQMPGVFIGGVLDTVMFSTLSKFAQQKPLLGVHFFNFITIATLIGAYLSVLIFTFADIITYIMLGDQWTGAVWVLQLLAPLIGFQLLSRMCDTYVRATGAFKKSITVKLAYLVTVFTLAFIGYQIQQIHGALVGIVLASAFHTIMMIITCQRDSQYALLDLWRRVRPAIILLVVLFGKNIWMLQQTTTSPFLRVVAILLTDALVIALLLRSTGLMGSENKAYINTRLHELNLLLRNKLGR